MLVQENHSSPSTERSSVERGALLQVPRSEVLERPKRRQYSAEYKRRILQEIESAQPGQTGAILRREGIYMSNILTWRFQKERGELEGLSPKKRGRKRTEAELIEARNKELTRENKRLRKKLERAELLLDIQKKISEITGIPMKDVESDEED